MGAVERRWEQREVTTKVLIWGIDPTPFIWYIIDKGREENKMELLQKDLKLKVNQNKFGLVLEQKQSRQLKKEITEKVMELIVKNFDGVETIQTTEGIILTIPNDEEGCIPVLMDFKMKPLDIDFDGMHTEWETKQKEKEEKQKEKEKKKKEG